MDDAAAVPAWERALLLGGSEMTPFFEPPAPQDAPAKYPELEERAEFRDVQRHRFEIPRLHTAGGVRGCGPRINLDD